MTALATITPTTTPDPAITFLPDIAHQLTASYRAAGRSEKTIESYVETLLQFGRFLLDNFGDDDPDTISVNRVESYIGWVRATRSASTSKIRFVTLRAIWRWMLKRQFVTSDIFAGIPTPTVDQRVIAMLDDADVRAILATTDGPGLVNRRDRAIFHVLADTGCRRQDIAQAQIADCDLTTGRITFRGTKANRDRIAALSPTTVLSIKRYLRERERVGGGCDRLFVSRSGTALRGDGVFQLVQHRYRQAGVGCERAVHAFRSWAAVSMLDNGAGESEVMALLGWRSTQMLIRYQRGRNADRALARHASFSPVSGL